MIIVFENYRKIKSAVIELAEKITLIDGANGAGKSTILAGIKSLLTGDVGAVKAHANEMLTDGTLKGFIEGNGVKIEYPKLIVTGETEISASISSTDIRDSVLNQTDKKRAALFLVNLLKASPDYNDFFKACSFISEDERGKIIAPVWSDIQKLGWSTVSQNLADAATSEGRAWKALTGETYGTAKAENWRHKDYTSELDSMSGNQILAALEEAKRIHHDVIASAAVSEDRMSSLRAQVEKTVEFETNISKLSSISENHKKELKELNDAFEERSKFVSSNARTLDAEKNILTCPYCGKAVKLIDGKLSEYNAMPEDEKKKLIAAIDSIQKEIDDIDKRRTELQKKQSENYQNIENAKRELQHCYDAQSELSKLSKQQKTEKEDPAKAAEKVDLWERRLSAYNTTRQAQQHHKDYVFYKTMSQITSIEGVRRTKVSEAVGKFNAIADKVFTNDKWQYRADSDFSAIDKVGRGYPFFSDGEKWSARVIYQVVSSIIAGDKIVLIDTIEDVDRDRINELMQQLYKTSLQVVIARASDLKGKESLEIEKLPKCKRYTVIDGVVK